MIDKGIIENCIKHLLKYKSINTTHFIKNNLQLDAEFSLINRIRVHILRDARFEEDSVMEYKGSRFKRIRMKAKKPLQERFYFLDRLIWAIISAGLALLVHKLTQKEEKQELHPLEVQQEKRLKGLSDTVANLQMRIDTSLKKQ